jgi:hypothetical protein
VIDVRAQAEIRSALRADTPTCDPNDRVDHLLRYPIYSSKATA